MEKEESPEKYRFFLALKIALNERHELLGYLKQEILRSTEDHLNNLKDSDVEFFKSNNL